MGYCMERGEKGTAFYVLTADPIAAKLSKGDAFDGQARFRCVLPLPGVSADDREWRNFITRENKSCADLHVIQMRNCAPELFYDSTGFYVGASFSEFERTTKAPICIADWRFSERGNVPGADEAPFEILCAPMDERGDVARRLNAETFAAD